MVDFARLLNEPPRPAPLVSQLVIAVTGHRPPKLSSDGTDGYVWNNPVRVRIRERVKEETERLIALAPEKPCTCANERHRDPDCPLGQAVGNHPCGDCFRASHLHSRLRQVEWKASTPLERRYQQIGLSGVALGVDQDVCGVWARMGLPYVAVVPFPGQETRWPAESQRTYRNVLAHAAGIVHVSKERPRDHDEAVKALHARNDWMQFCADHLIAVWDGSSDGGTASAVHSWQRVGARITYIDPNEIREELHATYVGKPSRR